MIVTMELAPEAKQLIARHAKAAQDAQDGLWAALGAASDAGADFVTEQVLKGETGLTPRGVGGLAGGAVQAWPIDSGALLYALGVPADNPAAVYAGALDRGTTIYPKKGKALAVPISDEARRSAGPRDMAGLTLLPRMGRPPLLVRITTKAAGAKRGKYGSKWQKGVKSGGVWKTDIIVHWVLVPSVSLRRFAGWFTRSVRDAAGAMAKDFETELGKYARRWKK